MAISINDIKILRDKTGAGMADCKNALTEASGEMDKAIEVLRKKGIAKAAKRSEREAQEGSIRVAVNDERTKGFIAMFAAETDFAAKSDKFQDFCSKVFNLIVESEPKNMEELMALNLSDGLSVEESLNSLSGVIGEKLEIKKFDILASGGTVSSYLHQNGRVAVLAALGEKNSNDLGHELAMQIAASDPRYTSKEDVPNDIIEAEKAIYREQLAKEGKPENIIENILFGKLNKFYEENVLLEQEFIKDDKKKVKDLLKKVEIEKFIRYSF